LCDIHVLSAPGSEQATVLNQLEQTINKMERKLVEEMGGVEERQFDL
jgi:hypothetical protein